MSGAPAAGGGGGCCCREGGPVRLKKSRLSFSAALLISGRLHSTHLLNTCLTHCALFCAIAMMRLRLCVYACGITRADHRWTSLFAMRVPLCTDHVRTSCLDHARLYARWLCADLLFGLCAPLYALIVRRLVWIMRAFIRAAVLCAIMCTAVAVCSLDGDCLGQS